MYYGDYREAAGAIGAITFLFAIVFLVLDWLIAKEFQNAAELKGYKETKYLWYCFFFTIGGWLLVCALPNRNVPSVGNETRGNGKSSVYRKDEDEIDEALKF